MNAKEFLLQYGTAADKICINKKRILSAEHRAAEFGRNSFYKYTDEYADRLYEETEELYKIIFAVENAVERCPCTENERNVLFRKYILREAWEKIADEMMYSTVHLHRLEKSALSKLKIPLEYKDREAIL